MIPLWCDDRPTCEYAQFPQIIKDMGKADFTLSLVIIALHRNIQLAYRVHCHNALNTCFSSGLPFWETVCKYYFGITPCLLANSWSER